MKTKGISIGIIFLVLLVCTTCTKDEALLTPDEENSLLKAAKTKVMPSTATDVLAKAEEDWQNINNALQNAGSGEVVQLAEGLFYLHKSIIRWNFNGTLKGSGRDKTTIQTAPEMLFDVSECPPLIFTFKTTDGFFMFCFAYEDTEEIRTVAISDMTIIVDQPTTPYYQYLPGEEPKEGNSIQALHVQYEGLDNELEDPINLNVMYKNVAIIGEDDRGKYPNNGYSLYAGLAAFGASSGNFEAKNVIVKNAHLAILPQFFNGKNSTVTVKNCKTDNNDNGVLSSLSHSWNILNCDFTHSKGASLFLNKYSNMDVELPAGKSLIINNKVNVSGGVAMAGFDLENVELKNNIFFGIGYTGLYTVGGHAWSIKNNNFCDVTDPIFGGTLFLMNPTNFELKNNFNQTVVGPGSNDPSNVIGEGRECDE